MKKNEKNNKIICRCILDNQILINADGTMIIGCKSFFNLNFDNFKGMKMEDLIEKNKKILEFEINNNESQKKKCLKCCSLAFKK